MECWRSYTFVPGHHCAVRVERSPSHVIVHFKSGQPVAIPAEHAADAIRAAQALIDAGHVVAFTELGRLDATFQRSLERPRRRVFVPDLRTKPAAENDHHPDVDEGELPIGNGNAPG